MLSACQQQPSLRLFPTWLPGRGPFSLLSRPSILKQKSLIFSLLCHRDLKFFLLAENNPQEIKLCRQSVCLCEGQQGRAERAHSRHWAGFSMCSGLESSIPGPGSLVIWTAQLDFSRNQKNMKQQSRAPGKTALLRWVLLPPTGPSSRSHGMKPSLWRVIKSYQKVAD